MLATDLKDRAEAVLRELAGPSAQLRTDQWAAVEALVVGRRRALVVQRTGWGKSAVYFIATKLLREAGAGATVIISPLLALMRNQIEAAARAGVHALTMNSSNIEQWDAVRAAVTSGDADVLLVSPERLNNPGFRDSVLPSLAAATGLLVIDEAHCISDWGHDFRPDYRRIRTLLGDLPHGIPVLATTATANQRVVDDVAEQLETAGASEPPVVLRGSLERESLELGVLRLPSHAHRLAWLADHLPSLPGSGIVYTLTVAQAEGVASYLREQGMPVASYTGAAEPAERLAAEADLLANRVKALVATSALGMGFDKPDLGFVIHLGAPASPIAYYQQVGRAGRAVDHATVLLLPSDTDEEVWRYFASVGFPSEQTVRRTLDQLAASDRPLSVPALEVSVELSRSRLEAMLKVLDVDGAVRRVSGGWIATGQPWAYDAERYAKVAQVRADEEQAMRDYIATARCRMRFLREQLDDPEATDCGRCDNCTGQAVDAALKADSLEASRTELDRPGVVIEPRRMWPVGLAAAGIGLSGKIGDSERSEPGRVIARMTDIGWGSVLRAALHEQAPDAPVSEPLVKAAIRVLHDWDWVSRPDAVAWVPSRRRPELVSSLAETLAALGRMTLLGPLGHAEQPTSPGSRTNSAQRVRALHHAFTVTAEQHQRLASLPPEPAVLLVDDLIDSGWTMALAAKQLRAAGVGVVLPFALAKAG